MRTMHTSIHKEIKIRLQNTANKTAINVLHQLADWIKQEGHSDLANKMLKTFTTAADAASLDDETASDNPDNPPELQAAETE